MNVSAEYTQSETGYFEEASHGSMPTLVITVIAVAGVGYLANICAIGAPSAVSNVWRGFGIMLPPLGAILGFM